MTISRRTSDYCVKVVYDPDGVALHLTGDLLSSRPTRQEIDIVLRRYKISDTHVTVSDVNETFVEAIGGGFMTDAFGRANWYGRRCDITVVEAVGGAVVSTYRGFLIGIKAHRGKATLRLAGSFHRLLNQRFLANSTGLIIGADSQRGLPWFLPAGTRYIADVTVNGGARCGVETWTFEFLNPTQFIVRGSLTGEDGFGDIGVDFTSDSGKITALSASWAAGPFAAGDKVSIKTVYRYTATRCVDAMTETLTGALAGALPAADVHPNLATYAGSVVDQVLGNSLFVDRDMTVIEMVQILGRHMFGSANEFSDGRIGFFAVLPEFVASAVPLCKDDDLISLEIEHLPLYNVFEFSYGWSELNEEFTGLISYPATAVDNTSRLRYGSEMTAPSTIELRGFSDANRDWMRSMGEMSFERWAWARPTFRAKLKTASMNLDMDRLYIIDSSHPTIRYLAEPYGTTRGISPRTTMELKLADASFYATENIGACGYMFHDVGHLHDSCWVHF